MARKATPPAPQTPTSGATARPSGPAVDGSLEPLAPPPATIVKTHRNRRMIALAVALVALCALGGWWLFKQATHTASVVAVRNTIHAGQTITASDLGIVQISDNSGLSTVPASQMNTLVGQRAQTDLPAGGIVPPKSVATTSVPAKGSSVVQVAVKAGMASTGTMTPGTPVRVVYLPAANSTAAQTSDPVAGSVITVNRSVDGSSNTVDILVPATEAPAIQAAAAANRIAVVVDSKEQ